MNKEERWYREALGNPESRAITTPTGKHVFYKGFKLSENAGEFTVVDVRMTDFYTKITPQDLKILNDYGFTKGADYLMYIRDVNRVATFNKMAGRFERMKSGFQEKLDLKQNESFARKRIRNCETNLELLDELISFYETRLNNTNRKYKFN